MPSTIYLITGGCRSGKSSYAQSMCEKLCPNPIYLATSTAWDDDFAQRVQRHQAERGDEWTTIEEPLQPSKVEYTEQFKGRAVMIDCLTLWLTNYMVQEGAFTPDTTASANKETDAKDTNTSAAQASATDRALNAMKQEFDTLTQQWDATFFIVTNEVGSGTHAENHLTRKFVDAQGWLNQHVALKSHRVVHMVSGIPNVIKDTLLLHPKSRTTTTTVVAQEKRDEAIMLDKILSTRGLKMDEKGYFMIKLEEGLIVATFYSCIVNDKGEVCDLEGKKIRCCDGNNRREPMKRWECRTAKEVTTEIFERWGDAKDVVTAGHAAYIGREAQRAEGCLYAGKHYQQD
jgi:adenosylcobinamide kinase/adenosylcobinamide-phosphate guanylyltransferase